MSLDVLLPLIFSGSGLGIIICLTVLVFLIAFLLFPDRFGGLKLNYKDYKVEVPSRLPAPPILVSNPPTLAVEAPADEKENEQSGVESEFPIMKIFDAVEKKDRKAIEAAVIEYAKSKTDMSALEIEDLKQFQLMRAGFSDAIDALKKLDNENPDFGEAASSLVYHYRTLKAYDLARPYVEKFIQKSSGARKINAYQIKAKLLAESENEQSAIEFLKTTILEMGITKGVEDLYADLAERYKERNETKRAFIAYEKALKISPENDTWRFNLAYLYAREPALKMLALHHYEILKNRGDGKGPVENNLGIIYGDLSLKISKVRLIKSAKENTNAYGYGNLINALTEAGFAEDAQEIADRIPDSIKSEKFLTESIDGLAKAKKDEEEKKKRLMQQSNRIALNTVGWEFADEVELGDLAGNWIQDDGKTALEIKLESTDINLVLTSETYVWKGKLSLDNFLMIPVRRSWKSAQSSPATLALLGGPSSDGYFVIYVGVNRLRVVHIGDAKELQSIMDFKRVEK